MIPAESFKSGEMKKKAEKEKRLMDIPGIAEFFPDKMYSVDLSTTINQPLRTKDGDDFNASQTPLIWALNCAGDQPKLAHLLLEHGADPNIDFNFTYAENIKPLMLAVRISASFFPNETSTSGVIVDLLKHGAEPLAKDSNGNTAIDWLINKIQPGMEGSKHSSNIEIKNLNQLHVEPLVDAIKDLIKQSDGNIKASDISKSMAGQSKEIQARFQEFFTPKKSGPKP